MFNQPCCDGDQWSCDTTDLPQYAILCRYCQDLRVPPAPGLADFPRLDKRLGSVYSLRGI